MGSGGKRGGTSARAVCEASRSDLAGDAPPRVALDVANYLTVPLFFDGAALFFFEAADGAAFVGVWIGDEAVDLAAFVVIGEVLGNGKTFLIAEK